MILYRFYNYAYDDTINMATYESFRETPCGYWIYVEDTFDGIDYNNIHYCKKRWIAKDARRSFAYVDMKSAYESFKKRKYKQYDILSRKLNTIASIIKKFESNEGE